MTALNLNLHCLHQIQYSGSAAFWYHQIRLKSSSIFLFIKKETQISISSLLEKIAKWKKKIGVFYFDSKERTKSSQFIYTIEIEQLCRWCVTICDRFFDRMFSEITQILLPFHCIGDRFATQNFYKLSINYRMLSKCDF